MAQRKHQLKESLEWIVYNHGGNVVAAFAYSSHADEFVQREDNTGETVLHESEEFGRYPDPKPEHEQGQKPESEQG